MYQVYNEYVFGLLMAHIIESFIIINSLLICRHIDIFEIISFYLNKKVQESKFLKIAFDYMIY
jgi:hypothetical protein